MVLRGMAVDEYIIVYHIYARKTVCCLAHLYLKDALGHFQTNRHMQKPVSAMMGIEHGQI